MIYFIKKTILILFFIFFLPLTLLIIFLRPIITIRFGNLEYKRIGHLALDTAIYISSNKINKKKTFNFIGYSKKNVSNKQLIKIWKKYIKIYNLSFLFDVLKNSLFIILRSNAHSINLYHLESKSYLIKNKNFIFFDRKDMKKINYYLSKLKIPKNAKWVCIHNRDNEYLKKTHKYISNDQLKDHSHRNFNIKDLFNASEFLIKNGYYVIRIGNIQETKFDLISQKAIDYSNSKYKNDLMDIYLLSNCKFYLGSDSGIGNVAVISNKYVGLINLTYYSNLNIQSFKRFVIFKKFYSKKLKRYLSLREIYSNNYHTLSKANEFDNLNIKLIDNSSDEIENLSIEMEKKINGTWKISKEDINYHNIFWSIISKYDQKKNNNYDDIYVSNYYLKNNLYLLD